jgi:hypothetical protein
LRSRFRACGTTLQRQHTHDDLQTIRKPMLELFGQAPVPALFQIAHIGGGLRKR